MSDARVFKVYVHVCHVSYYQRDNTTAPKGHGYGHVTTLNFRFLKYSWNG